MILSRPRPLALPAITRQQVYTAVAVGLVVGIIGTVILGSTLYDSNWNHVYYPAARAVLDGGNPYAVYSFANPPWLLVLLGPLSLLPSPVGRTLFALVTILPLVYVAKRFKPSPVALCAFLFSFPVFTLYLYANLDALVMLGMFLPLPTALFVLLLKPQVGLGIALFMLFDYWRARGWWSTVKAIAPIAVVMIPSLLLTDWMGGIGSLVDVPRNWSLFPLSIPLGMWLIVQSMRHNSIRFALPASLFLSPHVSMPSWSAALVALLPYPRLCVVLSALSWLAMLRP